MSRCRRAAGIRAVAGSAALGVWIGVLLACAAPAPVLPVPQARQPDENDMWLISLSDAVSRLEEAVASPPGTAGGGRISGELQSMLALAAAQPGELRHAQRLRLDWLIGRTAALQAPLALRLAGGPAGGTRPGRTIEALVDRDAGRADFDQILERFDRGLQAYAQAIATGDPARFAPIGLLLQGDARSLIPIGSQGSAAQRAQAIRLSGRYADLARLAADPGRAAAQTRKAGTHARKAKKERLPMESRQ
jgi:hypothetical protein